MTQTILRQHFEGQANDTAATVANSGSGTDDPFHLVANTNLTAVYSTDRAMHGTTSLKVTATAGSGQSQTLSVGGSATYGTGTTNMNARVYAYFTAWPNASTAVLGLRDASDNYRGGLLVDGTGRFYVSDLAQHTAYASATTQTLSLNTWYRFEIWASGVGTTNGQLQGKVCQGDSLATLIGYDSGSGYDMSASPNLALGHYGRIAGGQMPSGATWYFDDFAMSDNPTTYLGPYVPGPAVSASVSEYWAYVNGSASVGVSGDTITGWSISPSSGTVSLGNGDYLAPVPAYGSAAVDYTVTATESNAKTASATVTVNPLPLTGSNTTTQTTVGVGTRVRVNGAWV